MANNGAEKRSSDLMLQIDAAVEKNKNNPKDVALQTKAAKIRTETQNIVKMIEDIKAELITKTGGISEDGKLNGAKDEENVANIMLGAGDTKSGQAYDLQKKLNAYVNALNKRIKDAGFKKTFAQLALDGKEHPMFKDSEEHRNKDFAHLNFEGTPLVAALAMLSEKEATIRAMEMESLALINTKIGGEIIPVDRVRPVVLANSNRVVAGLEYEADMFMAAYSSTHKPKMTFGTKDVTVSGDGSGKIKFRASGGGYDENGLARKTWAGTITYPKASGGDTTYKVTEEYYVVKPVVKVQSDVSTTLYKNCGNALDIQVPALGAEYNPSFSGSGCNIIPGRRGKLIVVPKRTRIQIGVSSGGMRIDKLQYNTKKLPPPNITIKARGRKVNPISGVTTSAVSGITLTVKADPDIETLLPNDTHYRIRKGTITIARGSRGVGEVQFTSRNLQEKLRSVKNRLNGGERLIFDLQEVERKNFEGNWVPVKLTDPILKVFVRST